MIKDPPFTQEDVRRLFDYDPSTGAVTTRVKRSRVPAGSDVGTADKAGYKRTYVKNKNYLLHRIIWLHVHGIWPKQYVDHIDGDPSNNALNNLRLATPKQNQANCKRKRGISGVKGVYRTYKPYAPPWRAMIERGGRSVHLGYFHTKEEAAAARRAAAEAHDGEFVRHE